MSDILIVEDEPVIRGALRKLLERHDHTVYEAESAEQALDTSLDTIDLVISDLRLPGKPGTDLINAVRPVPVLIMTSYASLRSAVDAMKMGAVDYIAKPFDHEEMITTVDRILTSSPQPGAPTGSSRQTAQVLVGESEAMAEVQRRIDRLAPTDTPVLITGESGTGKELVARMLHEQSHRSRAALVTINCATLPADQLEAELFGIAAGEQQAGQRGLVEQANGGSLFLDDISELPLDAQGRLLRLLEENEIRPVGSLSAQNVDTRLIAASHRDLVKLVKDGGFREDLYYRLNVVELRMPPLRERGDDSVLLAETLLEQHASRRKDNQLQFSDEALEAIRGYYWPGNVRELENAIERAVLLCDEDCITRDMMDIDPGAQPQPSPIDPQEELSLEDYFARFVIEHQEHMTETELARKLGISRKSLWERRQRLGIPRRKGSA